jgi:hypothetical protein
MSPPFVPPIDVAPLGNLALSGDAAPRKEKTAARKLAPAGLAAAAIGAGLCAWRFAPRLVRRRRGTSWRALVNVPTAAALLGVATLGAARWQVYRLLADAPHIVWGS